MTIIEARTKSHHSTNMTLVGPWSTRILLSAYPPAVNRNTWPAFCTIYNNKSSVGKMLLVLMFVGGVGSGNFFYSDGSDGSVGSVLVGSVVVLSTIP